MSCIYVKDDVTGSGFGVNRPERKRKESRCLMSVSLLNEKSIVFPEENQCEWKRGSFLGHSSFAHTRVCLLAYPASNVALLLSLLLFFFVQHV